MSRCKNCGYHFEETDGWQEYCSISCAMCYHAGRVVTVYDKNANNKAWKHWMGWWGNPKNHKYVRVGKPAEKPKIGKWVSRQCKVRPRGANTERNCDRFANEDDAFEAWKKDLSGAFDQWLFAESKESLNK